MGLSRSLIIFPLIFLTICVLISGAGGLSYNGTTTVFCGATGSSTNLQCTASVNNGVPGITYFCNSSLNCILPYNCPKTLPPVTFCDAISDWVLKAHNSLFISNALVPSLVSTSKNITFTGINASGFVIMLVVASTVVVIGALDFFGSGENAEGIHIAFMISLLLGIWGILSAGDGVLVNSPSSFFVQLNSLLPGIGTTTYIFLTMLYTLGTIGSISRSSGSGGGV